MRKRIIVLIGRKIKNSINKSTLNILLSVFQAAKRQHNKSSDASIDKIPAPNKALKNKYDLSTRTSVSFIPRLDVGQNSHKHSESNDMHATARNVPLSHGYPLGSSTRADMESRFGYDFRDVRIHTDSTAAKSAREVNAWAYTIGRDVAFDVGRYAPDTESGRHLLAHELAHVIQQSRGGNSSPPPLASSPLESGANKAASAITRNVGLVHVTGASAPGLARQPQFLTSTVDPNTLSDQQLEREVMITQKWLTKATSSTPETEQAAQTLDMMEREVHRRHDTQAAQTVAKAPKDPVLPMVNTGDEQAMVKAMTEIKSIKPSTMASGLFTIIHDDVIHEISQEQVNKIYDKAKRDLEDGLSKARRKAEDAKNRYQSQSDVDKKHWIVAPIVKAIGRVKDPGPFLLAETTKAVESAALAEKALGENDFTQAGILLAKSEASAIEAHMMFDAYFEGIISSGEMTVKALEITRDTSFGIAIGTAAILAAPIVAAGVGAAATGVGLGGGALATGATALGTGTVIAAGGAAGGGVLRGASSLAGQALTGDKISYSEVETETIQGAKRGATDALTAVVTGGVGKVLGPASSLGGSILKGAASGFAGGAAGGVLETSAKDINTLKDIKEGKINLNPHELLRSGLTSGAAGAVGGGFGGASSRVLGDKSLAARVFTGGSSAALGGATGAAIAGGSVEDMKKAALTSLITGIAASTAIHSDAPNKQATSKSLFPEVVPTETSAAEEAIAAPKPAAEEAIAAPKPAAEEAIAGPKPVAEEAIAGPKPGSEATLKPSATGNLMEQMAKERIERGLQALGGDPELKGVIESSKTVLGDGKTTLRDIAADSPSFIRDLWAEYKAGRGSGTIKSSNFDDYFKLRQREFRGTAGEYGETFQRGPTEIVVKAPKGTTEPGIDMITYDAKQDRIKLLDNKAIAGKTISKVSALEENLSKNLGDDIQAIKAYGQDPEVPPEVKQLVLPRLEAAKIEIDAFIKANPGMDMKSEAAQRALGKILDSHRVDRVVTTSSARPGAAISSGLTKKGFK